MEVREVMTNRVATIRDDASVYRAAEIVALSGMSDLMVLDEAGEFLGVVPEGDILRAALPNIDDILAEGGTLESAFNLFIERGRELAELPLRPMIIRNALAVSSSDHVAQAAITMIQMNIRLLPVVDGKQLVGVVTRADVCWAVAGHMNRPVIGGRRDVRRD